MFYLTVSGAYHSHRLVHFSFEFLTVLQLFGYV